MWEQFKRGGRNYSDERKAQAKQRREWLNSLNKKAKK